MATETKETMDIFIRNVPVAIVRRLRSHAALRGQPFYDWWIQAAEEKQARDIEAETASR